MTNSINLFRSLIIYGVCLPLAILLGYMLASPDVASSFGFIGLVLVIMITPLLLRWHYPWLIASWNMFAGFYFLPGGLPLFWVMASASFGISFLSFVMDRRQAFLSVPSINRPLIFLALVVIVTAKFTGGLGLNVFGSQSFGGKHYLYIAIGIIGYLALTAQRIPANKAVFYVTLFFLGSVTACIGQLGTLVNPSFYFLFEIFPVDVGWMQNDSAPAGGASIARLGGVCIAGVAIIYALLCRYGIQGILDSRKYWRLPLFFGCLVLCMFGGYRSKVIEVMLLVSILFCLEGLHYSKYLLFVIIAAILCGSVAIPFANKLPMTIQRSLAFLPLDLDYDAVIDARATSEWRVQMWEKLLPQIPRYFWLGKGYAIDPRELEQSIEGLNAGGEASDGSALAGDYHNGPLSVIIPFGIFGVIAFLWLMWACAQLLYRNFKYSPPELLVVNRFLLASFLVSIIIFFAVIGSLFGNLASFMGIVGLSIAINGGKLGAATEPQKEKNYNRLRAVPAR